ncbi:putative reverse transcriptase domain-containing protein [Tanacetum coccineum]
MSDSEDSTVTYTVVSSPFGGFSNIGSPGVDGPPVMPKDQYAHVVAAFQAPPSPDYVPGPEYPPSPEIILEPVYPKFMPLEDEIYPAKEQPLPAAVSPTVDSPGYVPESDPEEDLEEDDDEDLEEDPADYPADGRDDGDDEDELSDDDEDEEVDIKGDEEEEEHPTPADSTAVALPVVDQALSAEETEPFETDESAATPPPHPAYRVTARISIRDETPISLPPKEEVERLLAMSTPPSSPLSPWSSPLLQIPYLPLPLILSPLPVSPPLPQISSPPLPVSSPVPVLSLSPPASPIRPLSYQATMIQLRAEAASTSHSLPLPPPIILSHTRPDTPSSGTLPLHLLSTDRRADRPEVTLPHRKRAYYGFVATMDREIRRDLERYRMIEFETRVRQDIDEIYTRLDDEQSKRQLMVGRLNMLYRDRRVVAQQVVITELQAVDQRRQAVITEMLAAEAVHRGTEAAKETSDSDDRFLDPVMASYFVQPSIIFSCDLKKIAPKRRTTRLNLETTPAVTATATTTITNAQLQAMIDQGVTAVLVARDANTNGVDNYNSGTCARRNERATRECTYLDFMKCEPLNFKGTEGVVELTQWIEKMETVFRISNCSVENQIKFSTCTLLGNALTWWNSHELKVKGTDVIGYNQRFQELALLCGRMFPEESDKIEKYVGGLPDMIHRSVVASKPKTMQEATEMAIEVMDKRIRTFADRTVEKKQYGGSKPYAHNVIFTMMVRVLPNATNATKLVILPVIVELKNNNNRGNQVRGGNASAKVYAVRHAGTNPNSNVVMGMFLLNNRYVSVLFDTSADRSFVSTAFSSQIDITPTALDHYYDVELADKRIIGLNTILRGCTLNILNHPFNIDLMPVELGSFDAIINMDWLVKYQAIIICAEKIVRIPWGNETLFVRNQVYGVHGSQKSTTHS